MQTDGICNVHRLISSRSHPHHYTAVLLLVLVRAPDIGNVYVSCDRLFESLPTEVAPNIWTFSLLPDLRNPDMEVW